MQLHVSPQRNFKYGDFTVVVSHVYCPGVSFCLFVICSMPGATWQNVCG